MEVNHYTDMFMCAEKVTDIYALQSKEHVAPVSCGLLTDPLTCSLFKQTHSCTTVENSAA